MTNEWNDRAQKFLEDRKFECEPEPKWLPKEEKGDRNPDFFCRSPINMWVEVKTLLPEAANEHVSRIWDYLRERNAKVQGLGYGHVFVGHNATEKDAKVTLGLVNKALQNKQINKNKRCFVVVPNDPIYSEFIEFRMLEESGQIWFLCCKSKTHEYGYPYTVDPLPWPQSNSLISDVGATDQLELDITVEYDRFRLATEISLSSEAFEFASGGSAEGMRESRTRKLIRSAIHSANGQFKAAIQHREAPATLIVYQAAFPPPHDKIVLSALFGDLQYTFSPKDFSKGEYGFGPNAAWHSMRHRSTSALCLIRTHDVLLTIHNPWAHRPLPSGLFGGREYIPHEDGTLQLIDHTLNI